MSSIDLLTLATKGVRVEGALDYDLRYTHPDLQGVALWIAGFPMAEPDPDDEFWWDADEASLADMSGDVLVVAVGDDYRHRVSVKDLLPIPDDEYCGTCGQTGCAH